VLVYGDITKKVINLAIEVHKELGPGLLEKVYAECLCYEFLKDGIQFQKEKELPVCYKGRLLDCEYRMDFVVEDKVILELKSVDSLSKIHEAQILTYMKLSGLKVGLLINFNVLAIKNGIRRFVL
jgi:GxxExxY protein